MKNTGMIILAAGNSSRLGKPKQLLNFQGKTLLQHVCNEAEIAALNPIIVIVGANFEKITKLLNSKSLTIIKNDDWEKGMSSSISLGLKELLNIDSIKNIIISVCDQPYICADLFTNLITEKNKNNKGIVASSYSNTLGTPVLFDIKYAKALMHLTGNDGAKKLLIRFQDDVSSIPFLKGEIDIDTENDYLNLIQQAE